MTAVSYGMAALLILGLEEVKPGKTQKNTGKLLLFPMKDRKLLYLVLAAMQVRRAWSNRRGSL